MIEAYYTDATFYLIPGEKASFGAELTNADDPEAALLYFNYDNSIYSLAECIVDGQYIATGGIDNIHSTGYCDSSVYLYPSLDNLDEFKTITYFNDEENIEAFLSSLTRSSTGEVLGSWAYAEENVQAAATYLTRDDFASEAHYTLKCIDQNGQPVSGAMLQVCDETTCQVLMTDDSGVASFTAVPYAWEVHVLMAPAGYTVEDSAIQYTPGEGGELIFKLVKN